MQQLIRNDDADKMEILNDLYHNIRFLDGWNCFDVIPHIGKYHIELFQGDSVLISIRKVFITDKGEHRLTNEYSFEISNVKEISGRFAILENGTEINRVSNLDISKYTVFTSRFYDSTRSYRLATHLFTRTKSITNIY